MKTNYSITIETEEGTRTLVLPEEKAEVVSNLVKTAACLYTTDAVETLDLLVAAKDIIDSMLVGLHSREELENRTDFNKKVRIISVEEPEYEKKPHLFEAVKAAGSKGITLTADNIGDFDLSGLEFWTPEAELSLAKVISECLNAPNVMESIKNGTTTTEEAVKDIIATFKETHEGNLIYKFAADAEAKPKATPKAE